jgi:hypothetical protein
LKLQLQDKSKKFLTWKLELPDTSGSSFPINIGSRASGLRLDQGWGRFKILVLKINKRK